MIGPLVFFGIAAVLGMVLFWKFKGNKSMGMGLVLTHGMAALAGLAWMIVLGITQSLPMLAYYAIVVFAIATLGGVVLFSRHLRNRRFPNGLVELHALAAVAAFILLLIAALPGTPVS